MVSTLSLEPGELNDSEFNMAPVAINSLECGEPQSSPPPCIVPVYPKADDELGEMLLRLKLLLLSLMSLESGGKDMDRGPEVVPVAEADTDEEAVFAGSYDGERERGEPVLVMISRGAARDGGARPSIAELDRVLEGEGEGAVINPSQLIDDEAGKAK